MIHSNLYFKRTALALSSLLMAGFVVISCSTKIETTEITGGTGNSNPIEKPQEDEESKFPTLTLNTPSEIPNDSIYVVSLPSGAPMTLLVASLQGIVNKDAARIILPSGEHANWCKQILAEYPHSKRISPEKFINAYLKYASGYVLADDSQLYTVEMTVAGPLNAVILTEETEKKYGKGLECLLDVRGKNEEWLYEVVKKNQSVFNLNGVIQPTPQNALMCVDNAVCSRMVAFRAEKNENLCRKFYSLIATNSPRLGYGVPNADEIGDVKLAAEYGLYTVAADWAVNYSFLTKYQPKSGTAPFNQSATTLPDKKKAHYVMLMYSDGDNLDYVIKSMAWGGKYMDNKNCEGLKINWELPPMLKQFPLPFSHYRNNAPKDNYFLAATSGAGYTYPSVHKNLQQFSEKTYEMVKDSGLDYMVILDDKDFKTTEQQYLKTMLDAMPDLKGMFYMRYENYALDNGAWCHISGRPVFTFRHRLWAGQENYPDAAAAINASSRDITSIDAYSAVVIHAWSYGMDDVKKFIDMLDDDVVLVTADEFVRLAEQNVKIK